MKRVVCGAGLIALGSILAASARADTTAYFDPSQVATPLAPGVTSETLSSYGYVFACTRDKLFTGGTGSIIGRSVRVPWPTGAEAQAVTTPPPGVTDYKARLTLRRVDGDVFDLTAFSAKLLANTAGAGGSIEIMPVLDGEDGFADPLYFDATGYYGQVFSYNESPNPWGSTALLKGFDTYKIGLYVDFALVGLTLQGLSVADANRDGVVSLDDYLALDSARRFGGSGFAHGDFNGDGLIDTQDYIVIDAAWQQSGFLQAGVALAVPEPGTVVLALGAAALLRRRSGSRGGAVVEGRSRA